MINEAFSIPPCTILLLSPFAYIAKINREKTGREGGSCCSRCQEKQQKMRHFKYSDAGCVGKVCSRMAFSMRGK